MVELEELSIICMMDFLRPKEHVHIILSDRMCGRFRPVALRLIIALCALRSSIQSQLLLPLLLRGVFVRDMHWLWITRISPLILIFITPRRCRPVKRWRLGNVKGSIMFWRGFMTIAGMMRIVWVDCVRPMGCAMFLSQARHAQVIVNAIRIWDARFRMPQITLWLVSRPSLPEENAI